MQKPSVETLAIMSACVRVARPNAKDSEVVEEAARLFDEVERFIKNGPMENHGANVQGWS